MIHQVYFFHLVLLTLTHSDQALRKLRITSALFVCWKGRLEDTETLFLRSRQGHLSPLSAQQKKNIYSPLPAEYRFFITCPLCWRIHPKATRYVKVCIIQGRLTRGSVHAALYPPSVNQHHFSFLGRGITPGLSAQRSLLPEVLTRHVS